MDLLRHLRVMVWVQYEATVDTEPDDGEDICAKQDVIRAQALDRKGEKNRVSPRRRHRDGVGPDAVHVTLSTPYSWTTVRGV